MVLILGRVEERLGRISCPLFRHLPHVLRLKGAFHVAIHKAHRVTGCILQRHAVPDSGRREATAVERPFQENGHLVTGRLSAHVEGSKRLRSAGV